MLLKPHAFKIEPGFFEFGAHVNAIASSCLCKEIMQKIWNGFCFLSSDIELTATEDLILLIGEAEPIPLGEFAYSIHITQSGVALSAKDTQSLIHGYFTLLEHIESVEPEEGMGKFRIPCGCIQDKAAIDMRMVHCCVFPETTYEFLEKFIKICGAMKYNYFILEFWGMLQFDCLKELGWECALTKNQVRNLVALARDLGMEVVPFFNHWGHATGCRDQFGKHVVLDQNPRYHYLFDHTGYVWNIARSDVRELMKKIHRELIDICGPGGYFHIGCDEAVAYSGQQAMKMAETVIDYIREMVDDLASLGRRTIMWGDMLMHPAKVEKAEEDKNEYFCNCTEESVSQMLLDQLDRRIIIADWQYSARKYPIATSLFLKKLGFDVITCSYDWANENIQACADTVKRHDLMGYMHTTWHTLHYGMASVAFGAASGWQDTYPANQEHRWDTLEEPAALMRKVNFVHGNYEFAGWAPRQTGMGLP